MIRKALPLAGMVLCFAAGILGYQVVKGLFGWTGVVIALLAMGLLLALLELATRRTP